MNKLADLQNKMEQAIRHQQHVEDAAQLVKPSDQLSQADRIKIYRDSVNAIFINTLKSIYPVCQRLVGKQFFSAMSFKFIEQTESQSADLNDYGEDFPRFIAEFEHAQALPYLSDVAQLEWYWHRISLIAESQPVDLTPIAEFSEEELEKVVFNLPKQAFLFSSTYPIHDIWLANSEIDENHIVEIDSSTPIADSQIKASDELHLTEQQIDLNSGGVNLILFRDQEGLRMDQVPDNIFFMLSLFFDGKHFAQVGENYLANHFEAPFAQAFVTCCQQGWVAGFEHE